MRLLDLFLDYLFPSSGLVAELEARSPSELAHSLPRAMTLGTDTIALFEYAHRTVKALVWEVKYAGNKGLAASLGMLMYDALVAEMDERNLVEAWGKPIITAIPSSRERRIEKGFNQAELLARSMVSNAPERFIYEPYALEKVRHTESQTTTESRSKRLENLRETMQASRDVAGKLVIVVDDVTTTGATFVEAKRALALANARKVICIAIAH